METRRLRKCVPLKVTAHIFMFLAFFAIMAVLVYGILYVKIFTGSPAIRGKESGFSYYSTNLFYEDYSRSIDRLISLINVWNEHDAYENSEDLSYWQNVYFGDNINFQYAFYDTEGGLMARSDGFNLSPEAVSADGSVENGMIYYYSVDLNALQLYDIRPISDGGSQGGIYDGRGSNYFNDTWYFFTKDNVGDHIGYIYVYIPQQLVPGDIFYLHAQICDWMDMWKFPAIVIGGAAIIIFIICLVYTILSAGWSGSSPTIKLFWFDRMYTEIGVSIIVFLLFLLGTAIIAFIGLTVDGHYIDDILTAGILLVPAYMAGMFSIYSLARRAKVHNYLSQSLIYKLFHGTYMVIYQGVINNHLMRKYILVILSLGIVDLALMYLCIASGSFMFSVIAAVVYCCEFIYIGRKLMAIQEIAKGAKEIAGGHLDYKIDIKDMGSGVFLEFANNINNIGQGLNRAVDESIKSERMKADLITNVSHDIKTPLTSIINYVDLLKRMNITEEPAREYIDILDTKSQRLKMLIEDLVEASRASSGNMTLECNFIDFNELVQQVAGTYVEKYQQRQLELVLHTSDDPLIIYADGRRMYRVLDNLFNNAFKYAMAGSRIYIDLCQNGEEACFVMKNISQAPLNISAEELTQRFVRGDKSRTTEGSGLGLSIAESLVQLHGGRFKIYLDGDLFKAMIFMSCRTETSPMEDEYQSKD